MNPGKIVRSTRLDDASLFRFKPGYEMAPLDPALDWSAWNVKSDPANPRTSEPGTGGDATGGFGKAVEMRSEEHTSELQSLMRISYAVFCLKKKNKKYKTTI